MSIGTKRLECSIENVVKNNMCLGATMAGSLNQAKILNQDRFVDKNIFKENYTSDLKFKIYKKKKG